MRSVIILRLGGTGKSGIIRSLVSKIKCERENYRRIVFCDDQVTEDRKGHSDLWSAALEKVLAKVCESSAVKMRNTAFDSLFHKTTAVCREHIRTAPLKPQNNANSQNRVIFNHYHHLPVFSTASTFRSLCSIRCTLWNGAAALSQMREQSDGNYRIRGGFQFRVKNASAFIRSRTNNWQRVIQRIICNCRKRILLRKSPTVQAAFAIC